MTVQYYDLQKTVVLCLLEGTTYCKYFKCLEAITPFFLLTLLDMEGGLIGPPFFQKPNSQKTFSAKNLKKFLSLLLDLFFVHCSSIFIKTI